MSTISGVYLTLPRDLASISPVLGSARLTSAARAAVNDISPVGLRDSGINTARYQFSRASRANQRIPNSRIPIMRPDGPRDLVVGPDDGPAPPFPLRLDGKVIKGFGRGSKEVNKTFYLTQATTSPHQVRSSGTRREAPGQEAFVPLPGGRRKRRNKT